MIRKTITITTLLNVSKEQFLVLVLSSTQVPSARAPLLNLAGTALGIGSSPMEKEVSAEKGEKAAWHQMLPYRTD